MATLDFITSNPATDEILRQQKEQRDQQLADARTRLLAGQATDLETYRPSKLRALEAGATSAEGNAAVNQATVGNRIETSNIDLGRDRVRAGDEESEAGVRRQTAPNRVDLSGVNLDKARTEAGSEAVEAGVRRETAPVRVQQASVGLRKASAEANNSELQSFYKSVDLLNAGDVEGAREVARRSGQEIPQAAIDNADVRSALADATKKAKELYPNRPKDQQTYIQSYFDEAMKRRGAGGQANEPGSTVNVPGAPVPQETSTDKTNSQPADVSVAEWLIRNKVAADPADAWAKVRQSRSNPDALRAQIYNNALRSNGGDAQEAEKTVTAAMKFLGAASPSVVPSSAPAPAAAPAAPAPVAPARPLAPVQPAAQRPDMMTPGDGGRPVNVQFPPRPTSIPPDAGYSPGRKMWFTRDGRAFDENGAPVTP